MSTRISEDAGTISKGGSPALKGVLPVNSDHDRLVTEHVVTSSTSSKTAVLGSPVPVKTDGACSCPGCFILKNAVEGARLPQLFSESRL